MTPPDRTSTSTSTSTTSTPSYQASGGKLDFRMDASAAVLDLVLDDGTTIDLWEKTLLFNFDPQQQSVVLTFSPVRTTCAVDGLRKAASATDTPLVHAGDNAVDTLARPNPAIATFEYTLHEVAPRTTALTDPSGVRLLKTKLVFTTAESAGDPDALPITSVPPR